jgi:ribonuclease HI
VAEVLDRFTDGPQAGVFTDGGAVPNPGPGGWGAVYVVDGEMIAEGHGHDPDTTNNRMELTALIAGIKLVPDGKRTTIYTDSNLVARTMNEWASGWERRGWKRKTGAIKNLDLVREAFGMLRKRPDLSVEWVPAHQGYRWNEYADSLANAWRRDEV